MRGCCAPLVSDDKAAQTFCNLGTVLRRVLRGVARSLVWMCMLCCIVVEWLDLDLGEDKAHGD